MSSQSPRKSKPTNLSRLDKAFYLSLYVKAADGVVELLGGIALLILSPAQINRPVAALTAHAADHDADDVIYRSIANSFHHLTGGAIRLAAFYLIADAIIKLVLINEVLHKRYWAYIALIVVLSLLSTYQTYRIVLTHSVLLTALTLFDLLIIYLSAKEYRRYQLLKKTEQTIR
jgi:uncharacterized membrane protein